MNARTNAIAARVVEILSTDKRHTFLGYREVGESAICFFFISHGEPGPIGQYVDLRSILLREPEDETEETAWAVVDEIREPAVTVPLDVDWASGIVADSAAVVYKGFYPDGMPSPTPPLRIEMTADMWTRASWEPTDPTDEIDVG